MIKILVIRLTKNSESLQLSSYVTGGEEVNKATANRITQYINLTATQIFVANAMKTEGSFNNLAIELIEEISKRISAITRAKSLTCFRESP